MKKMCNIRDVLESGAIYTDVWSGNLSYKEERATQACCFGNDMFREYVKLPGRIEERL